MSFSDTDIFLLKNSSTQRRRASVCSEKDIPSTATTKQRNI
jgi:hypothetical protein